MKDHIIRVDRNFYTKDTTISKHFINDKYFGFGLEDSVRPFGIKVKKHTAIPQNWSQYNKSKNVKDLYKVDISFSNRFDRDLPIIYNIEAKEGEQPYILRAGGIEFLGARFHGGNSHENTEGCILTAENWNRNDRIYGSLEKKLTNKIKELSKTCQVYLLIRNLAQLG